MSGSRDAVSRRFAMTLRSSALLAEIPIVRFFFSSNQCNQHGLLESTLHSPQIHLACPFSQSLRFSQNKPSILDPIPLHLLCHRIVAVKCSYYQPSHNLSLTKNHSITRNTTFPNQRLSGLSVRIAILDISSCHLLFPPQFSPRSS